jgi:hypothetical protein
MKKQKNGGENGRTEIRLVGTRWINSPVSSQTGAMPNRPDFNKARAVDYKDQEIRDHRAPRKRGVK